MTRSSLCALFLSLAVGSARAEEPVAPLQLERTIALANVAGRIDHLSIDLHRNYLFVAELGNGTVDVIDLAMGKPIGRLSGLAEPQGIGYVPAADRIVVASGGDGTVRLFRGDDLSPAGVIELGDDADNVRVDPRSGHVLVGYGTGGIAVIDPVSVSKLAGIKLPVHPEGFRLAPDGQRVFVNLPDARQFGVIELGSGRQVSSWTIPGLKSNFPLAIEDGGSLLATVFRSPPRLVLFDAESGAVVANVTPAATPTTSSSTRDADGSMSAAERAASTCSRTNGPARIGSGASPLHPAAAHPYSCRSSIHSSSPFVLACCVPRQRSWCFDPYPDRQARAASLL
jgi:DNA-binding beta-propeller fold protein YncE